MRPVRRDTLVLMLFVVCAAGGGAAFAADTRYLEERAASARVLDRVGLRLELMPAIAAAKWRAGAPVADPVREQVVVEHVTGEARRLGLDVASITALVELQMRFGRELQQRLFDHWRVNGSGVTVPAHDLARTLRPELDALMSDLLRALYLALPGLVDAGSTSTLAEQATTRLRGLLQEAERAELLRALVALRRERVPAMSRIRASGVLRVGTPGDYAPFSLEQDGYLGGADIELAQRLAAHLGVEAVFVRTSWATLLADLRADRFDLAVGGITVTPERRRAGLFSRSYHSGGKTPIARCPERGRFGSLVGIDAPGVRVIVNGGGTNESFARQHLRIATIRVHGDNRSVFDEIAAGRADVMITDDVEVELQTRRHPDLCRTMPGTLTRAHKAVLMPRDRALRAVIDGWLRQQLAAGVPARLLDAAMSPVDLHAPPAAAGPGN